MVHLLSNAANLKKGFFQKCYVYKKSKQNIYMANLSRFVDGLIHINGCLSGKLSITITSVIVVSQKTSMF